MGINSNYCIFLIDGFAAMGYVSPQYPVFYGSRMAAGEDKKAIRILSIYQAVKGFFVDAFFGLFGPAIGGVFTVVIGYFLFRERLAERLGQTPTREDILAFKRDLIIEIEKVSDRLTEQMSQIRHDLLERHAEAIKRLENHGSKIDKAGTEAAVAKLLSENAIADVKNIEGRVIRLEQNIKTS